MTPAGHGMRVAYVGEPYQPCVVALSSLKAISLRELKLETHHRGRFLVVKTFCEPMRIASIINAVQDQNGDVDRIALHNFPINIHVNGTIPKDAIFAVKEPYYTLTIDGRVIIRIDHPSDLVRLQSDSNLVPSSMLSAPVPCPSAAEMKELGNAAFKRRDWQTAEEYYSTALGLKQHDDDLRRTLHRNRSMARLNLGYHEKAVQDALAAIIRGDQLSDEEKAMNWKSFFRAGRAEYELGDFDSAEHYFSMGLGSSPNNKELLCHLRRTEERVKEQQTGEYDFAAMSKSATKDHTVLDHASFLGNTKVAPAGDRGQGLFATKNLAPGDIIMVEKAFHVIFKRANPKDIYIIADIEAQCSYQAKHTERIYGMINKLIHNPKQARKYMDLYDGGQFENKDVKFVDGMAAVDTFRAMAISKLNSFACPGIKSAPSTDPSAQDQEPEGGADPRASGVWLRASRANHSCVPNGDRSFIGDMMILRATREIKAGEEIRLSYLNPDHPYPKRKAGLAAYGFECDCPLCQSERLIPAQVLDKRARIIDEFHQYVSATMARGGAPALPGAAADAERLMKELEATYPTERYQRLPRLECAPFSFWLCTFRTNPEESLERALRGLRDLGYFVTIDAGGATIYRSGSVVLSAGVILPTVASAALFQSGNAMAAWQLQELRVEIYSILHSSEYGIEELEDKLFGKA